MNQREQMNIVIVGHVDHGKSTVIGRLYADTGSLPEGKLEFVKEYCKKNSRPFEYAFLLDALKDEQAQGITIDTSRSFFKTEKRDYIIIDAPGHIEFLKNMVTGASRAEAALLVIDAKEGIQENSKRHGHIVSMLGIKQVVVLVNKMDLVDYDEEAFRNICLEFKEFLHKIHIEPINFIPISAFYGDNIVEKSPNALWYNSSTVLEQLDELANKKEHRQLPLRLPVQDIYKFTDQGDDRRIVAGTIVSGSIDTGDEVVFLPSGKRSAIASIERFHVSNRDTASAGEAIGVTLQTQIYIKPGEVMVKATEKQSLISSRFKANLFWVGKNPLVKNKLYKLKIGTIKIGVKLMEIVNIIDAAELHIDIYKNQVERHDVAECIFETIKPIAFDPISHIEEMGRFVIVDDYEISGGGIIMENAADEENTLPNSIQDREFSWKKGLISSVQRNKAYGHKSKFIVVTSENKGNKQVIEMIGKELEETLFKMDYKVYYLGISCGYEGREEHIRQIGELARIFIDSGQIIITSIFDLDDDEAEELRRLKRPNEIIIVNIGESLLRGFEPDANIPSDAAVNTIYNILKNEDII